jgi:hypothetical protein
MHNVAILGIVGKDIRNYFAESLRKNAFIYVFDGIVNIVFGG